MFEEKYAEAKVNIMMLKDKHQKDQGKSFEQVSQIMTFIDLKQMKPLESFLEKTKISAFSKMLLKAVIDKYHQTNESIECNSVSIQRRLLITSNALTTTERISGLTACSTLTIAYSQFTTQIHNTKKVRAQKGKYPKSIRVC